MDKHSITYSGRTIEFKLYRKKVKNINLQVKHDMMIVVSANEKVPLDFILNFVKGKASWILKNVKFFKDVQPEYNTEKEYISGESFKYLGKQYRLKVEEIIGDEKVKEIESVKYYQGFIYLCVKDKKNVKRKQKLIEDWFRGKAEWGTKGDYSNPIYKLS